MGSFCKGRPHLYIVYVQILAKVHIVYVPISAELHKVYVPISACLHMVKFILLFC